MAKISVKVGGPMPEYALVLRLNTAQEEFVSPLSQQLRQLAYQTTTVPPHLTLAVFNADEPATVARRVASNLDQFRVGPVAFERIGTFPPRVIYLAPERTKRLMQINGRANYLAGSKPDSLYAPHNWQPHIALVSHLDAESFARLLPVAQARFQPFTTAHFKLALIECAPYRELPEFVWSL